MKKLCAIGEALIDFIPNEKGMRLKDVTSFKQVAGGAPANVAAAVSRLGCDSFVLTQLGSDPFGDHIIDAMNACGIDTRYVKRSKQFDTSLAFVSLSDEGNRDFKFYRKTAADLQYLPSDVPLNAFNECGILHFCSVSLVESPMKEAHKKCIEIANESNVLISFDPNLRLSLWDDHEALKRTVREFLPCADIIKISDEELEFITGYTNAEDALSVLFQGKCQLFIYTKGKEGVTMYTKNGMCITVPGFKIDVVDTTGAGDSFIGAFLFKLLKHHQDLCAYSKDEFEAFLRFANAYAAYTTTKEGALGVMATDVEIEKFIRNDLKCKERID